MPEYKFNFVFRINVHVVNEDIDETIMKIIEMVHNNIIFSYKPGLINIKLSIHLTFN